MPDIHQPALPAEVSDPVVVSYNTRLGILLFLFYLAFYGAFVVINAFWPEWMAAEALAGLNVAIVFGLGLIIGAFLLAIVYAMLCKAPAREPK